MNYLFTFYSHQTLNFQRELVDLLKSRGFSAWLEQDGDNSQMGTDATLEEIDWVTSRRNFFKEIHSLK